MGPAGAPDLLPQSLEARFTCRQSRPRLDLRCWVREQSVVVVNLGFLWFSCQFRGKSNTRVSLSCSTCVQRHQGSGCFRASHWTCHQRIRYIAKLWACSCTCTWKCYMECLTIMGFQWTSPSCLLESPPALYMEKQTNSLHPYILQELNIDILHIIIFSESLFKEGRKNYTTGFHLLFCWRRIGKRILSHKPVECELQS